MAKESIVATASMAPRSRFEILPPGHEPLPEWSVRPFSPAQSLTAVFLFAESGY